MHILVTGADAGAADPRVRSLEGEHVIGFRHLSTVVSQSQSEERLQIGEIQLGNSRGDLREIEVLSVAQQVLDDPDGILASHLSRFPIKPLIQFGGRNKLRL